MPTDVPDAPLVPAAPAPAPSAPTPTPAAPSPAPVDRQAAHDTWLKGAEPPPEPAPLRNADGTFAASPPPTTDAPTAPADPATTEPQAPATADDPTLYVEARQGEETVRLRKDTQIPLTRHGKTEYRSLEDVQRDGMRQMDYDENNRKLREERAALYAERAKLDFRAKKFAEDEQRMQAALSDRTAWERYQQHLQLLDENEDYRRQFERGRQADEYEAERAADQAARERAVLEDATAAVTGWIGEAVARYPGVSEEEVRLAYADALRNGQAVFSRDAVDQIAATRAQRVTTALAPLQEQVRALEAELAKLRADAAAARQNATTQHALDRARGVPPTGPVGGSPPSPGPRAVTAPNGRRDLGALTDTWVRGG